MSVLAAAYKKICEENNLPEGSEESLYLLKEYLADLETLQILLKAEEQNNE